MTTLSDSVNPSDGVLSLREAILGSDLDSQPDVIRFAPALTVGGPASIRVTGGSLNIRTSLSIEGPGAGLLTIDAGHGVDQQFDTGDGHSVFIIDDQNLSSQNSVSISGLTITGGDSRGSSNNSGGAIFTRENLTLRSVHLSRNSANVGGGLSAGWPTIDSVIHVIDSTVSGNAASLGAGINVTGELTVLGSTVSGNTASNPSGSSGRGGGIAVFGSVRIDHSTITENTSVSQGGGVSWGGLPADVVALNHSIVSNNASAEFPNIHDSVTNPDSSMIGRLEGDYNLIGAGFQAPGANNLFSDDPLLEALGDYGGQTPSHLPIVNSDAIDAGDPTLDEVLIPFDQRGTGFQRILDGDANGTSVVDIGAIEFPTRINTQPTFSMGTDPIVLEDSGLVTLTGFAVFDPGNPDESDQSVLAYTLSNLQRPELFSVAPAIDNAGTLTFTPSDDAFGVTTLDVFVQDDGGTANGGVDTSQVQQLTITVAAVNDPPSLTAGPLRRVAGGGGEQVVDGFITEFNPGVENESGQSINRYTVNVVATSGAEQGANFFESAPEIDNDGNLSYAVRQDILAGTASLEVLVHDDGGTQNGGLDTSSAQIYLLAVVPSDFGDAPDTFPVTRAQLGAQHLGGTLRLGTQVDGELDGVSSADASVDDGDDGVLPIASMLGVEGVTTTSSFEIIASDSGLLSAWIDFTADGDWDDVGEQIAIDFVLNEGSNTLSFEVPDTAQPGSLAARYRLSSAGSLAPTGLAEDGEVEDYLNVVLDSTSAPEVLVDAIDTWTSIALRDTRIVVSDAVTDLFGAPIEQVATLRVLGTDSDDTIELDLRTLSSARQLLVSGAAGVDTLLITGADGVLDLTTSDAAEISEFAVVDLGDQHVNTLVVDVDVARSHASEIDSLLVSGGDGDRIQFLHPRDWRMGPAAIENGVFLRSAVHTGEDAERIKVDLPHPWQNIVWAGDVNNSGSLSPIDALVVINELGRGRFFNTSTNQLFDPVGLTEFPELYIDTNGDGIATPRDALLVINEIERMEAGGGEGESMEFLTAGTITRRRHAAPQRSDSALLYQGKLNLGAWFASPASTARESVTTPASLSTELSELDIEDIDASIVEFAQQASQRLSASPVESIVETLLHL